jgi:hypothetical protein
MNMDEKTVKKGFTDCCVSKVIILCGIAPYATIDLCNPPPEKICQINIRTFREIIPIVT